LVLSEKAHRFLVVTKNENGSQNLVGHQGNKMRFSRKFIEKREHQI
jgi:hypothetical protein